MPGARPAAASVRIRMLWFAVVHLIVLALAAWLGTSSFPLPAETWRLASAEFRPGETETPTRVALPHNWATGGITDRGGSYLIRLDPGRFPLADGEVALFVPRFSFRLEAWLDGRIIATSAATPSIETVARNTSMLVPLHRALWRDDGSLLEIRLESRAIIAGFLAAPYVGPLADLRPAHEKRLLLFIWLPVVLAALSLAMAGTLLVYWYNRDGEGAYGLMALSLIVSAVHAVNFLPVSLWFHPYIHLAAHALPVIEAPLTALALRLLLGLPIGWRWLILVPGLLLPWTVALAGTDVFARGMLLVGLPVIGLSIGHIVWIGGRVFARGDWLGLFLALPSAVTLLFWANDLLVVANVFDDRRIFLTRFVYPLFTSALGAFMILRFVQFLNEADDFARTLERRVSEAEDALRASFMRDQAHMQASALAAERSRLMRDLHDGVGGQLVSIVASSERVDADPLAIGAAARHALRDMRLVIDAMDDVGGDLMLVLATWRERSEAALRGVGMSLRWTADPDAGLPIFQGLRPRHVLNVLRILEEALTNAIKHSGARAVEVCLLTIEDAAGNRLGRIVLADDGQGGAQARGSGRGLANMTRRAEAIGARLTITSDAAGTRVELDIPTDLGGSG